MQQDIAVSVCSEFSSIPLEYEQEQIVMVSLECPQLESDERASRAPIDLCCVLDKSGSMQGEKLRLVKAAMEFVVTQLKPQDRITIVAFDSQVSTLVSLQPLDDEGKAKTLAAVQKLQAGSCTNLSGGLFEGLTILKNRPQALDVTSVLLFTDGLANEGIKDTSGIVAGIENMLPSLPACAIFSFGFGDDHDSNMLGALSSAAHGLYYHIKEEDGIPRAFGECIGGLLSVAAQNVKVELQVSGGGSISKVLSAYRVNEKVAGQTVELQLGDMYSEEKKDLLFRVKHTFACPPSPMECGERPPMATATLGTVTVNYFNALSMAPVTHSVTVSIPQVGAAVVRGPSTKIDVQVNRIAAAESLAAAHALADTGKHKEAQALLKEAIQAIQASLSSQDPFCLALVHDMEAAWSKLRSAEAYTSGGHQYLTNMSHCHRDQRCTETAWHHDAPQFAQQCYTNSSKARLLNLFKS